MAYGGSLPLGKPCTDPSLLAVIYFKVVDSCRIFFETGSDTFQKCFDIWKGSRISKKIS